MRFKRYVFIAFLCLILLTACVGPPFQAQAKSPEEICRDPVQVAEKFYSSNDAGDFAASLGLLSDDVVLVTWAEGANGHHMTPGLAVGKDQVAERLGEPGLKRTVAIPEQVHFQEQNRQVTGNVVSFDLMPDHNRPDGRPFNHYSVELVFKGCQIEMIKVIERVTWL